jgi:hypothetical protein
MMDGYMEIIAELQKISESFGKEIKQRVEKAFEMRHNTERVK